METYIYIYIHICIYGKLWKYIIYNIIYIYIHIYIYMGTYSWEKMTEIGRVAVQKNPVLMVHWVNAVGGKADSNEVYE